MTNLLRCNAQISIDTLKDITSIMRESLTVNVEKHSQQIACQPSKMLDILLSGSLGGSPLKNQIITIRLQRQNSLV